MTRLQSTLAVLLLLATSAAAGDSYSKDLHERCGLFTQTVHMWIDIRLDGLSRDQALEKAGANETAQRVIMIAYGVDRSVIEDENRRNEFLGTFYGACLGKFRN